jgi:hypothetical protein
VLLQQVRSINYKKLLKFENVINPNDRKGGETLISCGAREIILAFTGSRDEGYCENGENVLRTRSRKLKERGRRRG